MLIINRSYYWGFTLNDPISEEGKIRMERFETLAKKERAAKLVWHKQTTGKNIHVHGYIQFRNQRKGSGLVGKRGKFKGWHVEAKYTADQSFYKWLSYLKKESKFHNKDWNWEFRLTEELEEDVNHLWKSNILPEGYELKPWQKTIDKEVEKEPKKREIHWITSKPGEGKSALCEHLDNKHGDWFMECGGAYKYVADMIMTRREENRKPPRIICWDIPYHEKMDLVSMKALEKMKAGS